MNLAAGTIEGYLLDHVACVDLDKHPEIGKAYPSFPWGRYAKLCDLSVDMYFDREYPHILHRPSGLRVPIVWEGVAPYLYEKHMKDLKLASKLRDEDVVHEAPSAAHPRAHPLPREGAPQVRTQGGPP